MQRDGKKAAKALKHDHGDLTTGTPTTPPDKLEKYQRLWRAVRLHESQVMAAIEELLRIRATAHTEVEARDNKLAACRAEIDQIASRMAWLGSRMGVDAQRAASIRFTIEEMAAARAGNLAPNAGEFVRRDAEIRMANDEIDAYLVRELTTLEPEVGKPDSASTRVHRTSDMRSRRNLLAPVIELAQRRCEDPSDTAAVWATLQVLAEEKQPPLIGVTEDGLQYRKDGEVAYLNRKALDKRLHPEKRTSAAKGR